MAAPDPTASLPPIGVDPQQWYDLQRRQLTAQMLMQQAATPVQENNFPGQRIRSRIGPVQPLAQIAAAVLAGKQMKDLVPAQAQMYQEQMVPFGGAPPAAPSQQPDQGGSFQNPSPPPAAQASSPGAGAGGGAPSPAPAGSAPGVGPAPLNPMGLPPALAMRMFMHDPAKYGELIAGPDGWRTALMASGGDAQAARGLITNKLVKEGTLEVRKGGLLMGKNADGTPFELRNPDLPTGMDPVFGANGEVTGARLIPGVAGGEEAIAQAGAEGKERGTLHELHTQGGGTGYYFGVPNVPGAGGGAAPSGGALPPQPPQYFPPAGAGGARPAAPAAPPHPTAVGPEAGGANDPWQTVPQLKLPQGFGESDAYTQAIVHKAADKHVELSDKYGSEADLADARIAFNNEALKLLNGNRVEVGPLSDRLVSLSKKAAELGIDPKSIPWLPPVDVANNTDELKKFFLRNPLLNLKPTFGGRPAAAEFQVLRTEASPNENMLAAASRKLLEVDNAQASFTKQRAQAYDRYHDMGGNPLRFEQWYSSRFPFSQVLDKPKAGEPITAAQAAAEIARRKANTAPLSQAP